MIPGGEPLYTARTPYPDVLARGRANTVQMPLYRDASLVVPSSGTFTLYDPNGTAIVDAASITIASSIATYTISDSILPATATPLGEGWREAWSLTVGGVARGYERTAALARIQLAPTITDADILGSYPAWGRAKGTALTSFQGFIDEAWKRVVQRLLREGHLPYLIRTPDSLREAHLHLACALTARGLKPSTGTGESSWLEDAQYHETQYGISWTAANWQSDYDHDGKVDDPNTRQRHGAVVHTMGTNIPTRQARAMVRRWM